MTKVVMTDDRIVRFARDGYRFFVEAGDAQDAALDKAINKALAKLWRRKPLDMTNPRTAARYGADFAKLRRLVSGAER